MRTGGEFHCEYYKGKIDAEFRSPLYRIVDASPNTDLSITRSLKLIVKRLLFDYAIKSTA